MKLAPFALTATLLLSTAPVAWSMPAIDDATAAKLATAIDKQIKLNLPPESATKFEGTTTVKPEGTGFSFTLPPLTSALPGETLRTAEITGVLTPLNDTDYDFKVNLPAQIANIVDTAGAVTRKVTVGSHDIHGVWQPENDLFPSMVMNLGDVLVKDTAANGLSLGVKSIAMNMKNTVDASQILSGTADFLLRDLQLTESGNSVDLGAVQIKSSGSGVNFAAWQSKRQEIQAMKAGGDAAKIIQQLPSLFDAMYSNGGTGQFALDARNIKVGYAGVTPDASGSWSLVRFHMESDGKSDANGMSSASFSFGHDGLTAQPNPPLAIAAILPLTSAFKVTVENLPFNDLMKLAAEQATQEQQPALAADPTQATPSPASDIGQRLQALLGQAKTKVSFVDTNYQAQALAGTLAGGLLATPTAKNGAIGLVEAKLSGLDELITKLGQAMPAATAAGKPQAQPDSTTQGVLMALTMLQMQGELQQGSPTNRSYRFELKEDGSLKLNGADIGGMMGMNEPQQGTGTATATESPAPAPATGQ